jgi:dimethylsulfone monooxygenase
MHGNNRLQIGLFGANCSSGRAVTLVPERWSGSWPDNRRLALIADEAGIDFLLPIGRWKDYGGETDYQGTTLETITWATGILAATKRITVFGTVHAPIFNPIVAAKEMVTADHIGEAASASTSSSAGTRASSTCSASRNAPTKTATNMRRSGSTSSR